MFKKYKRNVLILIFIIFCINCIFIKNTNAQDFNKISNVVVFVKGNDDTRDIFNANTNWNLIEKMYNKNEIGSVDNSFKNYIKTISEGKLEVENYFPQESEDKLSVNTYTLSKSISEYQSSDSIVEEVIDAVKNSKISYNINSKLDNMNTSYLDNLTIIVQGNGDNSIIGSHKAEYSGTNKINGLSVSNYNIIPSGDLVSDDGKTDDGKTNVARYAQVKISHEFLHTLGLPDLYRKTDVGEPVGSWDIMAKVGYILQYPLSYLRYKQGWIGSNEITKSGTYTLDAVSGTGSNKLFILKTPLSDSEYIALEYRKKSTNLTDIESGIPNSGLLMYRINNKVEDFTNVKGQNYIYIYRPDVADKDSGNDLIESGDYKGFNKYYNATLSPEVGRTEYGSTDLTKSFTDNTLYYSNGQNSGIRISNVKYSSDKNQITFDVDFANYNEENLWDNIGVLSGNSYGSILYKDKQNNLIYVVSSNGSGSSSKVSVKKINGNTLEQIGNEISDANYPSLAIYNNNLYIMVQSFNGYLNIYKLDGSTWTKISEYKTNYPKNAKLIESNSGLYAMYEETVSGYTTKLTIKDVINNKVIAEREAQDFGNPAVSFYNNKIYLAYSSYFGSDNSAKIESFDLTKNEWKVEKKLTINKSNIHSIKQYGNKLYILVGADGISPIVYTYDGTTWSEDKIDLMSNYSNLNMNIINDNIYISYINTKDNKSYLLKLSSHKSEIIDSNLGSDYSYLYTENDKENMYAITSDVNSNSISIKTKKIETDNSNSSTDDKKNDNNNDNENIDKSKNGFIKENGNTYYYVNGKKITGRKKIDGIEYYFDNSGIMHGNILFLGDSLTDYYNLSKYYKNELVINSGIAGNSTDDILNDMYNRVYKYNPSKIFLLIGTNDIVYGKDVNYITNNINKIIDLIRKKLPNCKIYLESLYPINNTNNLKVNHNVVANRTNDVINQINTKIKEIPNITYINIHDSLVDTNGNLNINYTVEGLHINDSGYITITNILNKYINNPDGSSNIRDKWYYDNNYIYYYKDGELLKGIYEIDKKKYLFGITSGKLYTSGVAEITYGNQQGVYYTNSEGIVQTGFQTIGKDKYYFNEEGKLQKGIVEVAGKKYLLGITSGKLYTAGLAEITYGEQQGVYYTNSEGQVEIGFKVVGKNKYYFDDETGKMVKNTIRTIENDKYYFDANGAMQYGIQTINGQKYLFGITSGKLYTSGLAEITYGDQKGIYYTNSDGILLNGIQTINGQKYLFGINSYKLYFGWAQTPNGNIYYSDPTTGIIYTGRLEIDNNWYNFDDNGVLQTGWQTIDNKEYYFYADGTKARGMSKISGSRHLFSDTGECLKKNVKLWIDVSYAQGDIEWDSLWKSGDIDGVILRIGRGAYIEDAKFKRNIAAVKRLGIPYSIYYFSYAENTAEALQEARNMVHIYKKYGVSTSIPTYYDIEYYTHMTSEQYKNIVETYSKFARQNGIDVKVYASARFAEKKLLNYTEWVAHYTGTKISDNPNENIYDIYPKRVTDYKGNWKIWQYSNNGHVTGIKGRVDFNVYVR